MNAGQVIAIVVLVIVVALCADSRLPLLEGALIGGLAVARLT